LQPYPLTVAPYSFLWFELQPAPAQIPESTDESQTHEQDEEVALELLASGWSALANGRGLELLQTALPPWLLRQRFFGAKTKSIASVSVIDFVAVPLAVSPAQTPEPQGTQLPLAGELGAAIFFLSIRYTEGDPDTYQIPLALSTGRDLETIQANAPNSVLTTLSTGSGPAILHDAVVREDFRQALLKLIEESKSLTLDSGIIPSEGAPEIPGELRGCHSTVFAEARGIQPMPARTGSAEQSNTSILYGSKMILKLFRRLQPGQNPDVEIGRFLTEVARFPRIAPFLGDLTLSGAPPQTASSSEVGSQTTAVAMLQELVANEGDGWSWTLEELARFFESVASCPPPENQGAAATFLSEGRIPREAEERADLYLAAAGLLGRRTAEMHLALATETADEAFKAEPLTAEDLLADAHRIDAQINRTLDALKLRMSSLVNETADDAATILSRRIELFSRAYSITSATPSGKAIRIHGDYHLGQVLRSKNDFVLLDFEGEPARSLAERRKKQCPLKDVAGMLRSFSYAAWSGLDQYVHRHPDSQRALEPWLRLWENSVATAFLNAYRRACAGRPDLLPEPAQAQSLLNAYLLEKALYELLYELNNRPTWVRIPLAGILGLPSQQGAL
jgi:maltose alpha-D-glucosyltransferase/alpha-amylase